MIVSSEIQAQNEGVLAEFFQMSGIVKWQAWVLYHKGRKIGG